MPNQILLPSLADTPVAHALFSRAHQLRWTNVAWNTLVGTEIKYGTGWIDCVHPADLCNELPLLAHFQSGLTRGYTCQTRLRGHGSTWIPVNIHIVRYADDEALIAALPISDFTRTCSARSIVSDPDYLVLAAGLSHDARQHLRLITSYLSLFERRVGSSIAEQDMAHVHTAEHHAIRLNSLMTDIVRWLRLHNEKPELGNCNLALIWERVCANTQQLITDTHATVIIKGVLPTVFSDNSLLMEGFGHLLRNALQYHDGTTPLIRIAAAKHDSFWRIDISDTGPGIPTQEQVRIFAPFQRLHSWEQVPGNGMGLAITFRIISCLGGSLHCISEPGSGCTIRMEIPA